MPFDINSAVEISGTTDSAISTTSFDIASANEATQPHRKVGPISQVLRLIFRDSPIEQIQTLQKTEFPRVKSGESFSSYQKRVVEAMRPREEEIESEGVLRQVEAPMQLAIGASALAPAKALPPLKEGASLMSKAFKFSQENPAIATAGGVAGFSIVDSFFNGRRWLEENAPNTPPLIKDFVEIIDFGVKVAGLGFGTGFAIDRMDKLNLPKATLLEPKQVEAIKGNDVAVNTLGIKQEHIDASINNQLPVQVPIENVFSLAMKGEWAKISEKIFGTAKEAKLEEQKTLLKETEAENPAALELQGSKKLDQKESLQLLPEGKEPSTLNQPSLEVSEISRDVSISPTENTLLPAEKTAQGMKSPEVSTLPASMQRERGFVKSVQESSMVTKETKAEIKDLPDEVRTYDVYTDVEAVSRAKERVEKNPEEALAYVLSNEPADKDVSATGLELMRRYREQGNIEQEVNVAATLAEKGTKAGQFIQAYSILDKLSPEGILVFAQRELNKGIKEAGKRKKIDPKFAEELKAQAAVLEATPYGYQKVKETNKLLEMIAKKKGRTAKDWTIELLNVPRTMMSSMLDFSFGLRQGLFLMPSYPKEWGGAFKSQFGAFAKEKNYDALMDSIMKQPDFPLADQSGVAFTDIRTSIGKLEEQYMGANLAEKLPLIGGAVRATNRAYTGMANKMRMDVFSKMIKDMENIGLEPRSNKELLRQTAAFVNAGTGRGGLGAFTQSAPLLNAMFYSPRLMSSRLTLLNPQYYITREPGLRKQALKSLFSFMGLWGTILGLAKLNGADVGTDPRSSDFGKIKIDNTRIDIGGGFAQWMRMFGQQFTGEYVSSTTGKKITLGEGYKPLTRYEILLRQLESKAAPVPSLIIDLLRQQNIKGEPVNVTEEVLNRFTPMIAGDIYNLLENDPDLLPLGILPVFGIGVQSYEGKKTNKF